MKGDRKKRKKQTTGAGSRRWEAVIGGLVAIAMVGAIFWMTNTGGETGTESSQPAIASPPTGQANTPPPAAVTHAQIEAVERIDAQETKRLLDAGEAITIDVRDVQSYVAGHIPGALQIPLQYVPGEIPWFPRDKKIITYCT